jgi:predicted proteasome-type protease
MHYVNKQLEKRVIKTTCGNGLVNVTETQTNRRPLMDHNTTDRLQLQNVIHYSICFFVSATRSNHALSVRLVLEIELFVTVEKHQLREISF